MQFKVSEGSLDNKNVIDLLQTHLKGMADHSPAESIHALGLNGLKTPAVTFWCVWDGANLCGCGALLELDSHHGEIKSMRTSRPYLGKGVATTLLRYIIATARKRSYQSLNLETGSGDAFMPAHRLYLKYGFKFCGPFSHYVDDPFSRFMTKPL